jgi:hypothetical protein
VAIEPRSYGPLAYECGISILMAKRKTSRDSDRFTCFALHRSESEELGFV